MYEPSRNLNSFYVAGFQHYDGASVLKRMEVGAPLELVGEPDNPYDPEAVMLRFEGTKIGYVPKEINGLASLMLFYGHAGALDARITQVSPEAAPWEQVRVGIFLRDARKED